MTWHTITRLTNNKWLIEYDSYCKDCELDRFFIDYMNLLNSSSSQIIIIFDMRKVTMPSISQLTKYVIFIQKIKSLHKEKLQYFYLVITTNIVKDIVDWVFTLTPPVVPYKIVNSLTHLNI